MVQVRQGKLNFTTMSDIPEGALVLMLTFSINDTPVKILFDSGANHSFVSGSLVEKLSLSGSQVKDAFTIVTPDGKISSHTVAFGVPLSLGSSSVQSNLIVIVWGYGCYLGYGLDDPT
jgi:hypothetical protein